MSMLRELESLLREIAEQQAVQKSGRSPRPTAPGARPVEAEIVEAEPVEAEESVAEYVQHHLNTNDITNEASQLGAEVARADDNLQAHIHDRFDHDLSVIDDLPTNEDAPATPESDIAKMLRNPTSIRQAIILSEILSRPPGLR